MLIAFVKYSVEFNMTNIMDSLIWTMHDALFMKLVLRWERCVYNQSHGMARQETLQNYVAGVYYFVVWNITEER